MNNDTDLLRDAMDRTTDGLPPLPDLVPLAVREGRRRRSRSRFAVGAAAFGVVTAGALGLTLLPGTTAPAVSTPASGGATYSYPPVVVEETPGITPPDNPEELSPAERERRAQHQQKMAALLDELLPATITGISPVKDRTPQYRITAGGKTYLMIASVRPAGDMALRRCENPQEDIAICKEDSQLWTGTIRGFAAWSVTRQYMYDRRTQVELTVHAKKTGHDERVEPPVTEDDLYNVAKDPRFLELVKEADAHPVEPKEPPLTVKRVSPAEVAELFSDKGQRAR